MTWRPLNIVSHIPFQQQGELMVFLLWARLNISNQRHQLKIGHHNAITNRYMIKSGYLTCYHVFITCQEPRVTFYNTILYFSSFTFILHLCISVSVSVLHMYSQILVKSKFKITVHSFILLTFSSACYCCVAWWLQLLLPGHSQCTGSG